MGCDGVAGSGDGAPSDGNASFMYSSKAAAARRRSGSSHLLLESSRGRPMLALSSRYMSVCFGNCQSNSSPASHLM